ncbi:MAG: ORF6N domain-containing protein [Lentisphaerae bacterium]|jgi:hypothetical protein|nr:ORF6N domain-containing protein [Lentisphaerota bacterium]
MANVIKMEDVRNVIVTLRDMTIILDCDIADIYGVETKRVNEAVKNNPDKFPMDYMFEVSDQELEVLRSKFSTTKFSKTRVNPKAFTEKGLYMIATILKSKRALEATFGIIETFAKIRELTRTIDRLSMVKNENEKQNLMQRSGELIAEVLDNDLRTTDTETSVEINFAVLKFKHTIKKADKR